MQEFYPTNISFKSGAGNLSNSGEATYYYQRKFQPPFVLCIQCHDGLSFYTFKMTFVDNDT